MRDSIAQRRLNLRNWDWLAFKIYWPKVLKLIHQSSITSYKPKLLGVYIEIHTVTTIGLKQKQPGKEYGFCLEQKQLALWFTAWNRNNLEKSLVHCILGAMACIPDFTIKSIRNNLEKGV